MILYVCLFCGEYYQDRDSCPWCSCECREAVEDEDEW
jgi:hypothetical protein